MCDQSCLTLCDPMNCSPPGSSVHGDSPSKNTGVGCRFLLQGIFLTQGSSLSLVPPALAGRSFTAALPGKLLCFLLPALSSSGGRGRAQPVPEERGGGLLPPGQRIRINPSEFCCREIFLSWVCVHSAIHFYLYGLMDIYFSLWVIVQYSPLFFFFARSVPTFTTESSFSELLCAFHVPPRDFLSFL